MNVCQITSALVAVRSEVGFHIKASLILLLHICCLDSALNQFLSAWPLPAGKCFWSRLLVMILMRAAEVRYPRLCILGAPSCHHPPLAPRSLLILLDCPALPYFSASQFHTVISSVTLAQHSSLMAKWLSLRLPAKSLPAHDPSCHPCLGLLGLQCTTGSPSRCNQTHIRWHSCFRYLFFGKNRKLNCVVCLNLPLLFPNAQLSKLVNLCIAKVLIALAPSDFFLPCH